jgi:hypothetical protein
VLNKVIREKVIEWFRSDNWKDFVEGLAPDDEVYHAHIYADSALDPVTLSKVLRGYFEKRGLPLQRRIRFLGQGHGFTNIYYAQPKGMAHFELFLRHNPETVLEPMPPAATRSGKVFEYWDRGYMERYYSKYEYKTAGPEEVKAIEAYFNSDSWKHIYAVARDKSVVHSHGVVETNLHPEVIMKYAREAIERRHWKIGRAVSVVWDFFGFDQHKLSFLLSEPEVVLELELQYEPNETMRPSPVPVLDFVTDSDLVKSMAGLEYIKLSDEDVRVILEGL